VVAQSIIAAFKALKVPTFTQPQLEALLGSTESPVTLAEWTGGDRTTLLAVYAKIKNGGRDQYLADNGLKIDGANLVPV